MKRTLLTTVLALAIFLPASGNNDGVKDPQIAKDLQENLFRAGVNTCPYEYMPTEETPVPRGFKPFYISHYGRHGARSGTSSSYYPSVLDIFTRASEAGLLTPDGEKAFGYIKEVVRLHDGMDGRLTRLGTMEHRQIAGRMYSKYGKTVFGDRKRQKVRAVSSMVQRCIVSMTAFSGELLSRNPRLDFWWDTGERMQPIVHTSEGPVIRKDARKIINDYTNRHRPDTVAFYDRMFTCPDSARTIVGNCSRLVHEFTRMGCACAAQGMDDFMLRCIDEDYLYHYTVSRCMSLYLRQCNSVEYGDARMQPVELLVDDIIAKADEVIGGSDVAADLRFGHDYQLLAIASRLGVSGVAERLDRNSCQSWQGYFYTPFACNLQMVFYRNRAGEVLVKFYINEREARCTLLDGGPYYRWEDLKRAIKK
ncbi:MAG: hypothetical protein J5737_03045 [Bacteroidales bacterium]|nr:hypothetical protein [Bacteroidales bacterium]